MSNDQYIKELSFLDHLEELRNRIIRIFVYWFVASAAGWFLREPLLDILRAPAEAGARAAGLEDLRFLILEPAGGFMLMMQISLVAGVIFAMPLIFAEMWLFIEPALKPHEKRYVVVLLPGATALFLGGILFCYWLSPRIYGFLFAINVSLGAEVELRLVSYLYFMLRLILVFGATFELPLILMFLGFVGIVSADWLAAKWRYAAVIAVIVAAVATPTGDPLTMTALAAPLIILYFLSIALVKIVERRRQRIAKQADADEDIVLEEEDPYAYYQQLEEDSPTAAEEETYTEE